MVNNFGVKKRKNIILQQPNKPKIRVSGTRLHHYKFCVLISHFFSSSSSSNSFKSFLAVRSGDVVKFDVVRSKYVDQFKSDRTFTLILRLHHNVIKTAIRRISLAYSRISLADVAAKLKLESPKDAEYIIAKVNFFFEQVSERKISIF